VSVPTSTYPEMGRTTINGDDTKQSTAHINGK
jgi:hypothetical protein